MGKEAALTTLLLSGGPALWIRDGFFVIEPRDEGVWPLRIGCDLLAECALFVENDVNIERLRLSESDWNIHTILCALFSAPAVVLAGSRGGRSDSAIGRSWSRGEGGGGGSID
jgi:hypothetical protein